MPLRHRGPLRLQHPVPVGELVRPGAVAAQDDPAHEIVLALGVVVPDGEDEGGVLQLLRRDVEGQRLVEHRVDGVLLDGRLLGLDGLLEVHQGDLHVGV